MEVRHLIAALFLACFCASSPSLAQIEPSSPYALKSMGPATTWPNGVAPQQAINGAQTLTKVGSGTLNANANSVVIQGNYLYIVDKATTNALEVWDVTNPASPARMSSATLTNAGLSITVLGRYAYVVENSTTNAFEIFDISNVSSPSRVSQSTLANAAGVFSRSIQVQGKYAFISGAAITNGFEIWDVSNPAAPTRLAEANLNIAGSSLFISARYAYIVDGSGNTNLEVWDLVNPSLPARVGQGTLNNIGSCPYVQGRYAYIVDAGVTNSFEIWDVSNPAVPARVSQAALNNSGACLVVQGRYAYVVDTNTANSLEVWDVSNVLGPLQVAKASLSNNGYAMVAQGRYAYVVEQGTTNGLEIFDVGGEYIQQVEVGNVSTASLSVKTNIYGQDLNLTGGLVVSGNFEAEGDVNVGGHISALSGSAPAVTSCGTSPSIIGNDVRGTVTLGTASPTACTITFSRAWTAAPFCAVTGSNSGFPVAITSISATALVLGFSGSLTGTVNYQCIQ